MSDPPAPPDPASLEIRADLAGTAATLVTVQVSATDIDPPLLYNLPVTNGVASGTLSVPAGSARTLLVRAYDQSGIETHQGSTTIDVAPGTNPTVTMRLTPLNADQPITVTIGSVVVTVTPGADTLAVGATAQLAATIRDEAGNPVTGTVAWATADPGIAIVGAGGLVTARRTGTVTIAATFAGTEGTAVITVRP